jgi:plasmid stabilization system protein ParE
MDILFTPSARRQFLNVIDYIRRDNPRAATNFKNKAESVLRRLVDFPDSGRNIPEFPDIPFREVIVRPYRFFYRV